MSSGKLTEFFKKRIFCLISNPRRGITIAWIISLVLVFICFIVSCVAASRMSNGTSTANGSQNAASFAALWTALLLILISVFGTVVMRRYKAALPIGVFLGVIFIVCQQMLIIFAIFADLSGKAQTGTVVDQKTQAKQAMAVFAFFLFLIYGFFGSLLSTFRYDIIVDESANQSNQSYQQDGGSQAEVPPEYN